MIFEADSDVTVEWVREEAVHVRAALVLCEIRRITPAARIKKRNDVHEIIDQFVSQFGCTPLGAGWLEADRDNALVLLQRVLEENLAYGVERLSIREATTFAHEFLDPFPVGSRYFTNGTLGWHRMGVEPPDIDLGTYVWGSWSPILADSRGGQVIILDAGIIAISPERIGMLWVMDEE